VLTVDPTRNDPVDRRPLLAASQKMYLGVAETREWVKALVDLAPTAANAGIELAVLPTFPLLESTAASLRGTSVAWGAQDVAARADGAQTGEVSASVLAELGCRYVEIGHAERRRLFGETDEIVAAKALEVVTHRMVPLLCVGEGVHASASTAADTCRSQLRSLLLAVAIPEIVVAYEPVWAIGATEPAPTEYIRTVCAAVRSEMEQDEVPGRVIYGGSAGPGTYSKLAPGVDGLFLGRFVHDVTRLDDVIQEVANSSVGECSSIGRNLSSSSPQS
jgi:triosephosphate isomerase